MSLFWTPLLADHGKLLAKDIRPACAYECSMERVHPDHAAWVWLARWEGKPGAVGRALWSPCGNRLLAIGGARPFHVSDDGVHAKIWMLTTNALDDHAKAFMVFSRWFMREWAPAHYAELANVVPERNRRAQRWLTALGFDFGPAFVHRSGERVLPFGWKRLTAQRAAAGP